LKHYLKPQTDVTFASTGKDGFVGISKDSIEVGSVDAGWPRHLYSPIFLYFGA
jgi:hypothetical protein